VDNELPFGAFGLDGDVLISFESLLFLSGLAVTYSPTP
jgi:hypothetical protein